MAADRQGEPAPARILVVDDEPDLELLIVQRFRRQIREGELGFVFAEDGVSALASLAMDSNRTGCAVARLVRVL